MGKFHKVVYGLVILACSSAANLSQPQPVELSAQQNSSVRPKAYLSLRIKFQCGFLKDLHNILFIYRDNLQVLATKGFFLISKSFHGMSLPNLEEQSVVEW